MKKKVIIILLYVCVGLCVCGLLYSGYNIILWVLDNDSTKKQIDLVQSLVDIESVEVKTTSEVHEMDMNDPYYKYMNTNLINVNFDELLGINPNIVGWIQVNGTKINYPFVQTSDNDFYLHHSLDNSGNEAGWLFLDYRNNKDLNNKNTIIYAHGRQDSTMFGSLKDTMKGKWLSDANNYVIKISTPYTNSLWEVFSTYRIPTTSDYIQTEFASDEEFTNWLTVIQGRSSHNFGVTLSKDEKILTLSTCYNANEKIVLHARLIANEAK